MANRSSARCAIVIRELYSIMAEEPLDGVHDAEDRVDILFGKAVLFLGGQNKAVKLLSRELVSKRYASKMLSFPLPIGTSFLCVELLMFRSTGLAKK